MGHGFGKGVRRVEGFRFCQAQTIVNINHGLISFPFILLESWLSIDLRLYLGSALAAERGFGGGARIGMRAPLHGQHSERKRERHIFLEHDADIRCDLHRLGVHVHGEGKKVR